MDLSDYRQRQYNPQHPHSAAAAAAQARLRQRSSFGPDHPAHPGQNSSSASSSRAATPNDGSGLAHRSNTFGSFFDNDPIEVASPGISAEPAVPPSATSSRLLSRTTLASPATLTSHLHQPSPLAHRNALAQDQSAASSSPGHSHSSSPAPAYAPPIGTGQLGRSTSTSFGPLKTSNASAAGTNKASLTRPPVFRSQTGGPLSSFSPFFDDDHTAAVLASPVDTPQSQPQYAGQQHRQSPMLGRVPIAHASPSSSSSSPEYSADEGGRRGQLRSSATAGPSVWGSSAAPGGTSSTPAASSPGPSVDPWLQSGVGSLGSNRHTASPLVHSYKLPSRENSSSSDSGLWQNLPATASPVFAPTKLRNSRGPPPRATTLAAQHNLEPSLTGASSSMGGEHSNHSDHILPENLQAAVAVTMEPEELRQLQHSPISSFNIVDDPEEDDLGFGPTSSADPPLSRPRKLPPRMQTRLERSSRFRPPQRATTLDPASHLPRPQTDDGYDGSGLSPVQDYSSPSSRQSSALTSATLEQGGGGGGVVEAGDGKDQQQHEHSSTDSVNQLALRGVFDATSPASWNLRDVSPSRARDQSRNAPPSFPNSPAPDVQHRDLPNLPDPSGAFAQVPSSAAGYSNGFDSVPHYGNGQGVGYNQAQHQVPTHLPHGQPQQYVGGHNVSPGVYDSGLNSLLRQQLSLGNQQTAAAAAFAGQNPGFTQEQLLAAMMALELNNRGITASQLPTLQHGGLPSAHHPHIRPAPPVGFHHQHQHQQQQQRLPPYQAQTQQPPHYNQGHAQSQQHQQHVSHHNGNSGYHRPHGGSGGRPGAPAMSSQHPATGPRSALLEDFRTKRGATTTQNTSSRHGRHSGHQSHGPASSGADATAHWSLNEIRGHVVEFCMDQHGSRFAQERLDFATPEQVNWVFEEIRPHARSLMQDVFGNYVVQKMFEYGSEAQRLSLTEEMRGHVMELSLGTYGCRVIQKALDYLPNYVRLGLAEELRGHVLELVQDQNANHVVQKLLSVVDDPESVRFVSDAFKGKVLTLGAHCYSCRVLQRVFERCGESQARPLLEELHTGSSKLMADQYGNYVIQWILQRGDAQDQEKVINSVVGNVLTLSRHKFASNVVEQVVRAASPAQRRLLVEEVLQPLHASSQPHSAVLADPNMTAANVMMTDQYANYVLQRFLELCETDQKLRLVAILRPRLMALRRGAGGPGGWTKHLAAVERLVNEASHGANAGEPGAGDSTPSPRESSQGWVGNGVGVGA